MERKEPNRKAVQTFRDLIVWQKSMELTREIYRATKQMPPDERFGLTNQMRRAAVSIPSNIAEANARQTLLDYLEFLRVARGSLAELSTQAELAMSMNMMSPPPALMPLLEEVSRILQFLIMSLEKKRRQK